MKKAKRLGKVPPYLFMEISRLKAKVMAEGRDIIDLGIGDPDQPTPEPIVDKLCEVAREAEYHRYDESEAGCPALMETAARWYKKRFDVDIDPDTETVLLIGSIDGLAHLCWTLIDPGDISLVPDPGYTVYRVNTLMAGGEPVPMPLLEKNNFLPDLTAIPTDTAKAARLMFVNYPNNPTGAVADLDFYRDVVDFARQYDIAVCSDLAYSEVTYDGYSAPSILQVPGSKDFCIEMNTLSKTYNMTGWRIGFGVGNSELVAALNDLKTNVDSRQFQPIGLAAAYALENVSNKSMLDLYSKRRDILVDGLNALGWNLKKPKASLYVWAKVPERYTSSEFAKLLLNEAGVLVIPGNSYGEYGEGYVRMALTVLGDNDGDRITEAVSRIKSMKLKF
ncbi:LL-diaminopimelate aminotransferase [bacterium]|nr:LL-diaminopimelate aminotransferase [bacterium]